MFTIGALCLGFPVLTRNFLDFQSRHGEDGADVIGVLRLR
jgi:hypothetical protein